MPNVKIFIGANAEGKLKASITEGDLESQGVETVHSSLEGVVGDDSISLKSVVDAYNGIAAKKVKGFPSKPEAVAALWSALTEVAEKHAAQTNGGSAEADIEGALKDQKPKKERKAKESKGTRGSPLAGKTWAVGPNAIKARRMTSTGIGVLALKWALAQVSFTTEQYIADSNGGRFNDLQYDIDNGNIVELTGTPEEIAAKAAEWAEARKTAQAKADAEAEQKAKEAAEKKAKAEADKKAKAEKKEADKKAAEEKAAADAAAKAEAEKAAAEGAAAEGEQTGEQAENA